MWGIGVGNFVEGTEFYGPFPSQDAAVTWAIQEFEAGEEWHPFKLQSPDLDFNDDEIGDAMPTIVSDEEIENLINRQKKSALPKQVVVDLSELSEGA